MIKEEQGRFCYAYARPAVTADVLVFAVLEGELSVLLVRRRAEPGANCVGLPGGFVVRGSRVSHTLPWRWSPEWVAGVGESLHRRGDAGVRDHESGVRVA